MTADDDAQLDLVVAEVEPAAESVVAVRLVPRDGKLPPWAPGAHIEVELPGLGLRHYSLCGDRADRGSWWIAVLREPAGRGGSRWVHESLAVGHRLHVTAVRNRFPLDPAKRYLFIAGGIGITPLLPMLREAELRRVEWRLLYGGRTRTSMAFLTDLERYGERVVVVPQDECGLLDLQPIGELSSDAKVYCCGPPALLRAVEKRAEGRPPGFLNVERFTAEAPTASEDDRPVDVLCQRSGLQVHVPAGCSILAALRAAGVVTESSCEEGVCGTCETTVVDGVPDHRDSVLDDTERLANQTMMICVSRAITPTLTLDR